MERLEERLLLLGKVTYTQQNVQSNSKTLDLPEGATIKYAKLYWWGKKYSETSATKQAYLKTPTSDEYMKIYGNESVIFGDEYVSGAEITDLVEITNGEFKLDKVFNRKYRDVYSGWSIQIVYEHVDFLLKRLMSMMVM